MHKVACKAHDSSHVGVNFLAQSVFISKCKCLLEGIEYVFNGPIHCIIRCPVHNSVTTMADHLLDKHVPRNKEKHAPK